ncbi:MogA/MoaB family molybdenum cofactor biosynthesis protein [Natronolimnohabitans innermongolicus]|uniref:Molybdenum cofactor synthesis protein n=1 Tax=Natronolimnohabitans innermongolicus JCM 12255 TaxID=1227499 RepID=L9XEL2_9EURY|nr:molybdopterin-binding protein [Natronolimnohabitans innermongolicus]ELY59078.1 molybdenum cofactor synthesis protein [Natronolimnohabitans innermongolicus JCM 12255]
MSETDADGAAAPRNGTDERTESSATDEQTADGDRTAEGKSLGVGVVTIATERRLETDAAGETIATALKSADHEIVTREHIGSDHDRIQSIVSRMIDRGDVDVVLTAGATSIEPSDVAIEAVEPLLDKRLTAFGELFTRLVYEAVGTRAVAARTVAGVADGVPVFCLPGNADASRLALENLILPEVAYLIDLARADLDGDRWAVAGDEDENGAGDDGRADTDQNGGR